MLTFCSSANFLTIEVLTLADQISQVAYRAMSICPGKELRP